MLDRAVESIAAVATAVPTVRISSRRWLTALRLKSWLPVPRHCHEPILLAGHSLPRRVGATVSGQVQILCIAPREWLMLAEEPPTEVQFRLQPALREHSLTCADWSDAFATFVIEGRKTRSLLSKGCGLDLDRAAFPPGRCARTRFAQIPAIVQCLDEFRFELAVARSYSNYLHEWLTDAAAEWDDKRSA